MHQLQNQSSKKPLARPRARQHPAPARNSWAPSASRALKRTTRSNATKSANRTQPARVEAISTSTARNPDQPTSQAQSISSESTVIFKDSISLSDYGACFCRSKNHPSLESASYSTPTTSALAPATKKIKLARNEMLENSESTLSAQMMNLDRDTVTNAEITTGITAIATNVDVSKTIAEFVFRTGVPSVAVQSTEFANVINTVSNNGGVVNMIPTKEQLLAHLNEEYFGMMQNLSKMISESEFYTILTYGWSEAANVVIFSILLSGSKVPIFYRAIYVSNVGKTGECICAAILGIVNTLDTSKLAAIVIDTSFDMKCISTELELLIREIFQIPEIVLILNDVRFAALMISGWAASENQLHVQFQKRAAIRKAIDENELRTGVGNMGRIRELTDSELFWDALLDVILVLKAPVTLLEKCLSAKWFGFGEVSDGFRELYADLKTVETKSLDVSVIEKMFNARRSNICSKWKFFASLLDARTIFDQYQPEHLDSARRYLKKLFNDEADKAKAWDEFSRFQNEKSKKGVEEWSSAVYWKESKRENEFPTLTLVAVRAFSIPCCLDFVEPLFESFSKIKNFNEGSFAFEVKNELGLVQLNGTSEGGSKRILSEG
ncbi:hypothetical protein HK098_006621 [Nowakowskiella sp. JEL0407]|nr:hypothetical protein HK098_006621 [Nowakowskiella sp. JEL0407]